ncbi:MAG: tyrosine-type recombinase/integrase [Thainema sp.]
MAKGQVKIEVYAERLRLRWSYQGKRYCLSVGLPDSVINRKVASQKAQQIELDMLSGNFDPSLEKYRPESVSSTFPLKSRRVNGSQTFSEVFEQHWDEFVDDKEQRLDNPFTIVAMYNPIPKKVRKFGRQLISSQEAQEFIHFMLQDAAPATIKKHVIILNDFGNWVQQHKLVNTDWENPFAGLTKLCRPVPPLKAPPFSETEIQQIIDQFQRDRYYAYYTNYVRFLFMTGCRTGEAIGLQWKHIRYDGLEITFNETLVRKGTGTARLRKATKTNRSRTFPCNYELQSLLLSIRPEGYSPDMLVFPSPKGKPIDATNFVNRAWLSVLKKCGMTKENGLYRTQYNTRHTFISHMLAKGMSVIEVAKLTGHDPKILLDHYAGLINKIEVPTFF